MIKRNMKTISWAASLVMLWLSFSSVLASNLMLRPMEEMPCHQQQASVSHPVHKHCLDMPGHACNCCDLILPWVLSVEGELFKAPLRSITSGLSNTAEPVVSGSSSPPYRPPRPLFM
jgi:hypothetical protein